MRISVSLDRLRDLELTRTHPIVSTLYARSPARHGIDSPSRVSNPGCVVIDGRSEF